jgi:hypothetical protein
MIGIGISPNLIRSGAPPGSTCPLAIPLDSGEDEPVTVPVDQTRWYSYTAPADGIAKVDGTGDMLTFGGVYVGGTCDSLGPLENIPVAIEMASGDVIRPIAFNGPAFPITGTLTATFYTPPTTGFLSIPTVMQSRAGSYLWQDAGKTILATADGDPVRVWKCIYTGTEWTAPSDAARMILTDIGGGKWGLTSDGVNDGYLADASVTLSGNSTLAFRVKQTNTGITRVVQGGAGNNQIGPRRTTIDRIQINVNVYTGVMVTDSDYHTVAIRKSSGGNWLGSLDNADLTMVANTNSWGRVSIGVPGAYAETFAGVITAIAVYNANLTGTDLTQLKDFLGATS